MTEPLFSATALVETPQAGRYLAQLCKHFAHKLPVRLDEDSGHIAFSAGDCRLSASSDRLTVTVETREAARLAELEDVVARHLLRFAFREEMAIEWHPA